MKRILALNLLAIFMTASAIAQNVGIGTTSPDESAVLHLSSTTKGLLIPSMTQSQRIGIASPADGLIVYDLTSNRLFQYQNGSWKFFLDNSVWTASSSRNWVYNGTDSVGLGNAAPSERLSVSGNIRASGDLKIAGAAGIGTTIPEQPLHVRTASSGEGILVDAVNPILQFRQSNSPSAGYTNKGFIQVSGDNLRIGTNSGNTDGRFIIRNNGGDRLSVDATGNVNITGKITSNATGPDVPLTPVAYGVTADINTGGISRGTANVTVTRIAKGKYVVACPEFTENTCIVVSSFASGVSFATVWNNNNSFLVYTRDLNMQEVDQLFRFIAF